MSKAHSKSWPVRPVTITACRLSRSPSPAARYWDHTTQKLRSRLLQLQSISRGCCAALSRTQLSLPGLGGCTKHPSMSFAHPLLQEINPCFRHRAKPNRRSYTMSSGSFAWDNRSSCSFRLTKIDKTRTFVSAHSNTITTRSSKGLRSPMGPLGSGDHEDLTLRYDWCLERSASRQRPSGTVACRRSTYVHMLQRPPLIFSDTRAVEMAESTAEAKFGQKSVPIPVARCWLLGPSCLGEFAHKKKVKIH